ncbi:hypothetical protein DFA_12281 [Cavenderia fasciculata]|uniref:Cyanocobalamin reductase (cyanide-eliminating) n=1 Tax=Cavenderia fasciculata TaxID=261658 RepID=F4QCY1_CACFS|nr:uncharacterized protein DFA_12281 [Cavenderia fasciculata]EGG14505.1 hypothetical protein DFA_12281 [Cavenderia fasciculata]|eukprot:XP_004353914.1 hypothetical protein DFA_12281 [Cavenderia fasciculata]
MDTLIRSLQNDFKSQGFHLVEPFKVSDYNNICKFKVENYGIPDALGLIIGCNKYFWDHFVTFVTDYYTKFGDLPKDPMNLFCQETIERVVGANKEVALSKLKYDIRYDWNSVASGRYVHIQTAGHFAGIAHYDRDVMWSVHPTYGLWFVFRAIVVFNTEYDDKAWPRNPASIPLLDPETKGEMKKWTDVAIDEGWSNIETRLKIRDCCTVGKEEWKYQGDTFDYFYPLKRTSRKVIQDIIDRSNITAVNNKDDESDSNKSIVGPSQCCNGNISNIINNNNNINSITGNGGSSSSSSNSN